ncbi:MAG: methyltransferase, FxLD system [Streptosporangiaceae bacterium]
METTTQADELRGALVDRIAARHDTLGLTMSAEIERALRTVPRHLFTGDASLEETYGDEAVVTKRDKRGISLSSVSAPWLQATMLGQLQVQPGDRVLEIGSGGYNAALIRELVGADGSVTTLDIDLFVTGRAEQYLADAGYTDVEVICQDAEFEIEPGRRFDKILVTVGAWDIPAAWTSQLAEGGRLVVPLRTMGATRSWALEREGEVWVSRSQLMCGFVAMQGAGASHGIGIPLLDGNQVGLWLDEGQVIDEAALDGVLSTPRAEAWSGVTPGPNAPFSDQDLWLAARLDGFCLMTAHQEALDSGIVDLPWRFGTPAFVDGATIAYRVKPRQIGEDPSLYEFGAYAHGPDADRAAERLAEQIRAWDRAGRPVPQLSVYPAGTPDAALPDGLVLNKRHRCLVISWPTAR